jgi:hypothetical protein
MEKIGLCSSGGQGSQGSTAGMAQHTTNQSKPVDELDTKPAQGTKIVYIKRVKGTEPHAIHHQSTSTRTIPLQLESFNYGHKVGD